MAIPRTRRGLALVLVLLGGPFLPAQQQDAKLLPDQKAFLAEARKRLHRDRVLQSQYVYREKRTRFERDSQGHVQQTVRVYEVHPSVDEDLTYERLLSVDGKPVNPADLEKTDREHLTKSRERANTLQQEGVSARAHRLQREAEEREKERRAIDELYGMFDITMLGREVVGGHTTIAFRLVPRPAYKPRTTEAKIMKRFRVKAWISEDDYELAKVEAEAVDTVLVGLGLLARLDKGSHGYFQRQKVNNEIWLPSESRFTGSARVLLVKRINIDQKSEFSDYKKFDVDTSTSFQVPK